MVKISLSLLLIFVSACGSRELNLGALDLTGYTRNLSESQEHFPAYVSLMTPGNTGVVPAQVEKITQFFADKSQPKQLILLVQRDTDVDRGMYALAKHDKNSQVIELRMDLMTQDAKIQGWTPVELDRVIEAVLKRNSTENTIFFVDSNSITLPNLKLFESYQVLIKTDIKILDRQTGQMSKWPLQFIPLSELILYSEALSHDTGIAVKDIRKAALLLFTFMPHESFMTSIEIVLEMSKTIIETTDPILDAVFMHYQNKDPLKRTRFDLKNKMKKFGDDSLNYEPERVDAISNIVHEYSFAFSDENSKRTDELLEMILQQDSTLEKINEEIGKIRFKDE